MKPAEAKRPRRAHVACPALALVLAACAGRARAAEIIAVPGATGQPIQVAVQNPSSFVWLHGVAVAPVDVPGFILNLFPSSAATTPADLAPLGSGTAVFTFDVDAAAPVGTLDTLVFRATTTSGDTAELAVGVVVGALAPAAPAPFATDFEAGPAGFLGIAGWQWGVPSSGPGAAASGSYAWATNLAGDYGNLAQDLLYLVPVDLAGTVAPRLRFNHWYDMEWSYDGGLVLASLDSGATFVDLEPVGGYPGAVGETSAFTGLSDPGSSYRTAAFHLGGYAGQTVVLRLVLASDGSLTRPGWYVDDVSIAEGPAVDALAGPLASPAAVEIPWGANLPVQGDVTNLGAATFSCLVRAEVDTTGDPAGSAAAFRDSMNVGPLAPGATGNVSFAVPFGSLGFRPYVARLVAVAAGDADAANDTAAATFTPLPVAVPPVHDSFEGTVSQGAATGAWARGVPGGGPGAAFEGSQCWGAPLGGGYPGDHTAHLYLGAFDLTALASPVLRFRHWFDLEAGFDGARLAVSTDGSLWTVLRPREGYSAPAAVFGGDSAWTGASAGWLPATFDLGAYAGAARLVARLTLQSDASGPRPGWFVDSLQVVAAGPTGVGSSPLPERLALSPPAPSPSTGPMAMWLSLPAAGEVRLEAFGVDGRRVGTLVRGPRPAGRERVTWDARDGRGARLPSGIYLFRLTAGGQSVVRRAVVMR